MDLPQIKLPEINLPFDIPVLLHPPVDHFVIALPVVILLLELYNLFAKRKSIGGFSFILLILTILLFAAAYLTGTTDGKEAFDYLSPEGQEELKAHKLLGTYLMFGSVVLLLFRLLAATGKGFLKALYLLVLVAFIAIVFKQGKDGGELVYEYGANVEKVKTLDDEMFDLKEELEDAQEAAQKSQTPQNSTVQTSEETTVPTNEEKTVAPKNNTTVETLIESAKDGVQKAADSIIDTVKENASEMIQDVNQTIQPTLQ